MSQTNSNPNDNANRETKRLLFLALIVAAVVAVLHFTPLKQFVSDLQVWKAYLDEFGWKAHVAFVITSIIAIAMGVPRLGVALAAGTLFGFVDGFVVAMAAALIGSYVAFLTAKRSSSEKLVERIKSKEPIRKLIEKPSVLNIFFVRQLPVPALALNLLLGLVHTPHRKFLLGTFLGQLPSTGIVASMGSAVGKQDPTMAIKQVSLGMAGLAVIAFVIILVRRKFAQQ